MECGTRDVAQWYSTCLTKPWNLFQIQEKEEGERKGGKGQQQANTARLHFIRMSPSTEEMRWEDQSLRQAWDAQQKTYSPAPK